MQFSETNPTLTLPDVERQAWTLLVDGSRNPKDAFYTGTLGTLSTSGPSLRTVVLRQADPQQRSTVCYSDVRAGKVAEIRGNSAVSWLFWDDARKVQLRLTGRATVHTDDALADGHWQSTSPSNRRSYLAGPAPGSVQPFPTSGLPEGLDTREPTEEESAAGRPYFAVIITQVERLEWLWLTRGGHRRAVFRYAGTEISEAAWLVP
jgi:hypothetical protein